MMNLLGLLLVVATSFLGSHIVEACSCRAPKICYNYDLMYTEITGVSGSGLYKTYAGKVLHNFLSDQRKPQNLVITSSHVLCAGNFDVGEKYIISGNLTGADYSSLDIHICYNYNEPMTDLTAATERKKQQTDLCSGSQKRTVDTNGQRDLGSMDDESFIRALFGNGRHIVQRQQSNDWIEKLANGRR